ncbi:MAG: winged helix-turn-helix transcriptional regulator [Bacteroidetes bacterium]|nr:winged helix-turn-helix transcriptional regulator [Bacteroidota bacterium]
MKFRLVIAISLFSVALLISSAFLLSQPPQDVFMEKRAELVVRQIGHQLLQYAGDSTSRVLPVKRLSTNTFQLEFQNHFAFMPDTLVKIVRSNLALIDLPVDYLINVFDCASKELVYGFEIRPGYKEIVPCRGRAQPRGCYTIQISFVDFQSSQNFNSYYPLVISALIGLSLIAFTGRYYLKSERKEGNAIVDGVSIGKYSFSLDRQLLKFNSETIELSHKEVKLLSILAARQNDLISREELLKKVWEDDGVFTGRSLDMFISKLRKKFKNDPCVQITNVHGKGYKLEIKPEL